MMDTGERAEWRRLVMLANRLGHEGKRVRIAEVLMPTVATDQPVINLTWDFGPASATEVW